MVNNTPIGQNGIGIKEISQLQRFALGEGAAACEACGKKLREGAPLVAFAFRPADQPAFEIGHVKCINCRHEPTEYFTLGVRELVVEGRVGTCRDHATQSSWPVLAPRPRVVSPPDTTEAHPLPGTAWTRRRIAASDTYAAADACTTRKPWQRAVRRTATADADPDPPTSRADGGFRSDPVERPDTPGQVRWSRDD